MFTRQSEDLHFLYFTGSRERPPGGRLVTARRNIQDRENTMVKPLTSRQKELLKRRGLDPSEHVLVRALYGSIWVKNIRTGTVKIIDKRN